MINILIADDQNLVQQGIKSLLDLDTELKVIGAVKDGRSAIMEVERLRPDIVLLDIEMPHMNGITTTKYISRVFPQTKVIILSSYADKKYVMQALMAGAKGYLLKSSLMTDLKQAILAVQNGYSQIDSRLLAKVFDPSNVKGAKPKSNHQNDSSPKKTTEHTNAIDENPPKIPLEHTDRKKLNDPEPQISAQLDKRSPKKSSIQASKFELDSPDILEQENLKTKISDSTILEQSILAEVKDRTMNLKNTSDSKPTSLKNYPKRSPVDEVSRRTINFRNCPPLTIIDRTAIAPSSNFPIVKSNSNSVDSKNIIGNFIHKLNNHPKIAQFYCNYLAQHQPKIKQLKLRLTPYISRTSTLLKLWHQQGWLGIIGLVILGAIIIIVIGKL